MYFFNPHLVLKLCGLPADLPRNLASFSPSVDDRNRGGSGPRGLSHQRRVLWWNRSGTIRVMLVGFDGRFQRSYRRTCKTKSKELKKTVNPIMSLIISHKENNHFTRQKWPQLSQFSRFGCYQPIKWTL